MSKFAKKDRQRIIDGYLAATGHNMFRAGEFIDWLGENQDHEAYPWFYGTDDETAAREYRISLARSMASGLRIVAQVSSTPGKSSVVQISTREFPAYVSPMDGRNHGGGYQPFDPDDPAMLEELRAQGAQGLRSWLSRYRGAAEASGVDVGPIEEIVSQMSRDVVRTA